MLSLHGRGGGGESLYKWSRSHDKDVHPDMTEKLFTGTLSRNETKQPYMTKKYLQKILQNQKYYDLETWHAQALQSLYK